MDTEHAKYMYGSDRYKILANISSRTWITPTKTAKLMKKMVDDLFVVDTMDRRRVLDMTGNCGGNILPFLDDDRYTGVVYEISPDIHSILASNMTHFGRGDDFVSICGTSMNDANDYDVIIVDPPFGDEYGKERLYQPTIDGIKMSELVVHLHERCKHIIMKLPRKWFDVDVFLTDVSSTSSNVMVYTDDDLRKIDGNIHKIMIIIISPKN